jgi:peroxiredoxin
MRILKYFGSCIAASLLITSAAEAQNAGTFVIKGTLKNVSPMPPKIYLIEVGEKLLEKAKDSTEVKNGQYQFTGHVDEAVGAVLSADPVGMGKDRMAFAMIVLDQGELDAVSDGSVNNIHVTGNASAAQHQFEDMRHNTTAESEAIKKLMDSPEYKTNTDMQNEVKARSGKLLGSTLFDMYNYTRKNPAARVTPYVTYMLMNLPMSATAKDTLMKQLPVVKTPGRVRQAIAQTVAKQEKAMQDALAKQESAMSKIPVGSKALDFTQNDVKGNPVSLASFKGKYVLVDFWASWCMPCRAENPNVVKAYQQYKGKGFTVLGVSLDGTKTQEAWIKAIEHDGLIWTQVSDLKGWDNAAAKLYGVASIPQNFLIDPNGVVIAKNLRGEELNKKLASVFK